MAFLSSQLDLVKLCLHITSLMAYLEEMSVIQSVSTAKIS